MEYLSLRLAFFVLVRNTDGFGVCRFENKTSYGLMASLTSNVQSGITIYILNVNVTIFLQ